MAGKVDATVVDKKGSAINFARGRPGDLASALGYDKLGELTNKQRTEVFRVVFAYWASLVRQDVKSKDQAKYLKGMVPNNVASDPKKVEWALKGFDAISIEFGWAPPDGRGHHKSDGLGEWDGAVHDMRSYMLTEGNPGLKTSKPDEQGRGGGKRYLLVPFHENARPKELAKKIGAPDTFKDALKDLAVGDTLGEDALAGMDPIKRLIKSRRFVGPLQRKGGHIIPPAEGFQEQRLTGRHKYSKYHNMIRNYDDLITDQNLGIRARRDEVRKFMNERRRAAEGPDARHVKAKRTKGSGKDVGFRFTMIRTITDDMAGRSWMTTGTPPVELLVQVRRKAAQVISNVLMGRDPEYEG